MNEIFVSVVMPVYNSELFLSKAIESILDQTHSNFELIIINDGSTDSSSKIINYYASQDGRIKSIERENKGLIFSLNEGIKLSKSDYIVRMDSDDISRVDRIELQLSYLLKNKDIAVLGSKSLLIDQADKVIGSTSVLHSDYLLKSALLYGPVFMHPTVMFNRKLIEDDLYYDDDAYLAEDYELWLRLSIKYKFSNLNHNLLSYRINNNGVSQSNKNEQIKRQINICKAFYFNSMEKNKRVSSEYLFNAFHNENSFRYFKFNLQVISLIGINKYSIIRFLFVLKNTIRISFTR